MAKKRKVAWVLPTKQDSGWPPPAALATSLLRWFDAHARDLPWRRSRDLYAIWISEIMLQQTQVATVIPYWKRFLARFPNVQDLAAAAEHDVLQLWEGLGYYRRARQLHAAARRIVEAHAGQFPATVLEVRSLPGIGRYTAGAILSIGLDQRLPILEANTIRVLSRLSAYRGDVKSSSGQKHLWSLAESLLPSERCGAFNQALMELGSQICSVKEPKCARCPLATWCQARQQGLVAEIPLASAVKKYEAVTEIAVVIRRGQKVLLRQCQAGERWAALWDFPRFPLQANRSLPKRSALQQDSPLHSQREPSTDLRRFITDQTRALTGLSIQPAEQFTTLKHGVTRFRITLHCFEARLATRPAAQHSDPTSPTRWIPITDLTNYPMNTTARHITRLLVGRK